MKFAHIADLHIGKRVNDFSMLEDQKYILNQIIQILIEAQVDAVLIAGDVYDKSVPSAEAVALCDEFITKLSKLKIQTFIISGNHDCPERIAFGARIMEQLNIHIAPVFMGKLKPYTLEDEYGPIDVYMLPFIKPGTIRRFYPEEEIHTYTDAVRTVLSYININQNRRNVLVAHQFVTGASKCESEELVVGGLDNVDAEVFDGFDYVALGHIHGPQKVARDTIRYCGTPLKYSFSEVRHHKSVTIVTMEAKTANENIKIDTIPLKPIRDLRDIRGTYEKITLRENYICTNTDDYIHITLTDEDDIPDAIGKLRTIYPNIMKLDYDNKRTRFNQKIELSEQVETKSPLDLFMDFYYMQNNQEMTQEQKDFVSGMIEQIWNK